MSPTAVGKEIENTPKTTWSIAGEYRIGDAVPGLSLTAAAYYTGARAINNLNQAFIPSYTLFDLGFSYYTESLYQPMTFRLNAENVGNKRYWASTGAFFLAEGAPAEVKFSLETKF